MQILVYIPDIFNKWQLSQTFGRNAISRNYSKFTKFPVRSRVSFILCWALRCSTWFWSRHRVWRHLRINFTQKCAWKQTTVVFQYVALKESFFSEQLTICIGLFYHLSYRLVGNINITYLLFGGESFFLKFLNKNHSVLFDNFRGDAHLKPLSLIYPFSRD